MKKKLLPLALLLSLAAFLPATKESHAGGGICALDQECVFRCQRDCDGFYQPCFDTCVYPGCCVD